MPPPDVVAAPVRAASVAPVRALPAPPVRRRASGPQWWEGIARDVAFNVKAAFIIAGLAMLALVVGVAVGPATFIPWFVAGLVVIGAWCGSR